MIQKISNFFSYKNENHLSFLTLQHQFSLS